MLRSKPAPLRNRDRVAGCKRTQNRGKGRLTSAILGIDQRKTCERDIRSGIDGIEQPDISEQLDTVDHGFRARPRNLFTRTPTARPSFSSHSHITRDCQPSALKASPAPPIHFGYGTLNYFQNGVLWIRK